ncbi:discoidin domain-containing protein [Micromonospora sp. WMMD812]|uniref:discoidin domain-containing protein n=1 Tax=Micromonospora sp. WMMD812 TaxID=3015152 RepID=UPI00248B63C7|nr:discoidin domain-containing protein [Micromonospora sp. WMMD812]WBB67874.1 discoidin domain-containing protein [Micromonospora sp. WMMD812]
MPESPSVSRRTFLSTGATLLASFGVTAVLPDAIASAAPATTPPPTDLARYRPVAVSSTDYAPTPAAFAVDGLPQVGVRGSGWRAAPGGPQWISVDLQALCRVEAVTLVFEATLADGPFDGDYTHTDGDEILSSAAVAYRIEVSSDGHTWRSVHETGDGLGGVQAIRLPEPVDARWVRMTATKRSNSNPVGLNGFQVYGTALGTRPAAEGWTSWERGNTRPVPELRVAADGSVPLESGWALTMDDFAGGADGAVLSSPGVDVRDWLPATVPGTVLGTLVERGYLPDPVSGFNNLRIPEALSRHSWWYRRALRLPRGLDTSPGRHVWLEFDGINHEATTWVNGKQVGAVAHPFARAAYDITDALAGHSEHVVAVRVTPMPHPGTPGDKGTDGRTFLQSANHYLDAPTYLAVSGWDWMPAVRDRVSGLWDHVRLRSTGAAVVGDPYVKTMLPKLPDTRSAEVTIAVPVRNAADTATTVTVRAQFDKVKVEQTVTVPARGTTTVAFAPDRFRALRLTEPRLWWPNGYGEPHLHDLAITATVQGRISDRRGVRFGIREFGYDWHQPIQISPPGTPPLEFVGGAATQTVTFDRRRARHVRIQGGQRATGWGISMWSLSVADGDGADLARGRTASASSAENDSNVAGNVVDGDPGTRWASKYEDDQWIQVDLGAAVDFDRVTVVWEQAYALDYRVQVSDDGDTWTDVTSVSNETPLGSRATQVETFPAQTARHLRIQAGTRATSWGVSMWTLSVRRQAQPDVDLALHATATASSSDGDSNGPDRAVDGNPRTRWSSKYEDDQWIQVDLGAPVTFDQVSIVWEQAYAREFVIQVSDDGQRWTDVKSVSNKITELKITVNGVPVFARGGNWGWDELLRRVLPDRLADTVEMHRDMNFTMIRNWLGSSNREELYRACDEQGILVWNDFWQAGQFLPDPPGYVDIAADTIRRFRHHPSIVVWCGANEGDPPPIVNAGLARAVADEHPEILYIPNSAAGIVSGRGPYHWVDPATYVDNTIYEADSFGFHTEIGMPVVSVVESMRNLVGDQPEWPISEVWNHHDWSTIGNQRVGTYQAAIDARLGESGSLEEFATRAQFVNYESHRAMFEAWNANLWQDATGLLLWMSHPAWHSTVWQTYDYDLDVNGAYFGSRKACEPLHVQADPGTWRVRAVNHTAAALTGATVTARRYDLRGRPLGASQRQRVTVAPSSTSTAFALAAPDGAGLHLIRLELRDSRDRLLSENTYWRYGAAEEMRALNDLAPSRLSTKTGAVRSTAGRATVVTTVRNTGDSVAALVRLSVRDSEGNRVLPARYDDNYFWLLPGEERRVGISWPERPHTPRQVRVTARAYNSAGH